MGLGDAIAACGVAINAIVLVFLVVQVRLLREQVNQAKVVFVQQQERSRTQSTLEFMATTAERRHNVATLVPPKGDREAVASFIATLDGDRKARQDLHEYLNYYEMLAGGVNTGVLDVEVVDRISGGGIIAVYNTYASSIAKARADQDRPKMYEELQTLAATLTSRRAASGNHRDTPAV